MRLLQLALLAAPWSARALSTQTPYSSGRVTADVEKHLAENAAADAQKQVYDKQYGAGIELDQAAAQIGVDVATLTPYAEGDIVAVGAVSMRVIHTPGHSPGSSVLVVKGASGAERVASACNRVLAPRRGLKTRAVGGWVQEVFTGVKTC